MPAIDTLEPSRAQLRNDKADPRYTKQVIDAFFPANPTLRTEIELENCAIFSVDRDEIPFLPLTRTETEEPIVMKSASEHDEPNLEKALSDNELPM
jgi:hypothetical protein